MTSDPPPQRPEGMLIEAAAKSDGRSIRQLAAQAGMSDARWRQLVKGYQSVTGGGVAEAVARAETLAKMAQVLRLSPASLEEVGRSDAAVVLRRLLDQAQDAPRNLPTGKSGRPAPDEIEMIYNSRSMTAEEKLEAIRRVLHLRAQVEAQAEAASGHGEGSDPTVETRPPVNNGR